MARRSPALFAWALCGTLDIVYAAVSSVLRGGTVSSMLHAVASGPFGDGAQQWGISWQITPRALTDVITSGDKAAAKRAFEAMMTMKKIDVAVIEAAIRGDEVGAA